MQPEAAKEALGQAQAGAWRFPGWAKPILLGALLAWAGWLTKGIFDVQRELAATQATVQATLQAVQAVQANQQAMQQAMQENQRETQVSLADIRERLAALEAKAL